MSVFRIPFCTHEITISQSYALGNLNPPSKAGGLRLPFFQYFVKECLPFEVNFFYLDRV